MESENQNEEPMTREEYIEKLTKWLEDARLWHGFCSGFPYYTQLQNQTVDSNNFNQFSWPNVNNGLHERVNHRVNQPGNNARIPLQEPVFSNGLTEYVIPPLWKRLVAEFLDFMILLIIKLTLSLIVLETFNVMSLKYYGIDTFQKNLKNPEIAMQIYVELFMLEVFHKMIVCLYEAYFLKGGMCSTPGKRYMGLIVIYVENINVANGHVDDKVVTVSTSSPLGIKKSLIRSVLKNLFIGLLVPVCSLYIFRFNRIGYDMMANSLVVEYNPNPNRQN
ncbi:unnamed protein product [Brassicogethes aeneus]|uniref:RDD domain-containing protein n=1 Tax=Brassicogethes aeneus TaxID=1431903 RepID=A0A9P0FLQ7_BRAAE|nr:unnamed protein product [Brassicogethes aeneus]